MTVFAESMLSLSPVHVICHDDISAILVWLLLPLQVVDVARFTATAGALDFHWGPNTGESQQATNCWLCYQRVCYQRVTSDKWLVSDY